MDLFIQIKNGLPVEHPILIENFRQSFPHIDCENLPPEFARFERVPQPDILPYQVNDGANYEWVGAVVKDVWRVREMTADEKLAKQNAVKEQWASIGFASWIFDEATCRFMPPVPRPNDGKIYGWNEATLSWVEVVLENHNA